MATLSIILGLACLESYYFFKEFNLRLASLEQVGNHTMAEANILLHLRLEKILN